MYQKQSQRTKPSGNKEIRMALFFLSCRNILELEIIRAVPRLRVFKLNTVVIIGLIGNNGKTVIVLSLIHIYTMTASWGGMGVIWGKPSVTAYIRQTRYTKEFVDQGEYFTITFFEEAYRKALKDVYKRQH